MGKNETSRERAEFAARLQMARQEQYDSAKAFAEEIKEEAETYRMWERGDREPDITRLAKIARKLNRSLDFLILGHLPPLRPETEDEE